MIVDEARSKATKKDFENPKSPIHVQVSQLSIYDTPERRIALYKIFGDVQTVQDAVLSFPFKGFIGEMSLYENFVKKESESKEAEKLKT